jgi:hypothetical protein
MAHSDGRRSDGQPSLSGHCGHGGTFSLKPSGKLVGVDLARIQREAAASRDYLVWNLGWSRSVMTRAAPDTDCDRATARKRKIR